MKDELLNILRALIELIRSSLDHPVFYGVLAALARWVTGERKGGWWAFITYLVSSCFVAWAAALWMADETYSNSRRAFLIVLLSFAARDILAVILLIVERARANPLEVLEIVERVRVALKGGPKP